MNKFPFLLICLFAIGFISCKKEQQAHLISDSTITAADNLATCNAVKPDTENIQVFPATNAWNKDISASPVDTFSNQIIAKFASSIIHADFGSGTWAGAPIGIPYVVVCGTQQKYTVKFRANNYDGNYGNESDKGPYAIPLTASIEGNGNGDSHVIAVDKDSGILYELYNASVNNGQWEASSGAIFHFNTNKLRRKGWTSADAAGLPIFAGLIRYDELAKGKIDHAIRFTLSSTNVYPGYISPARHKVNSTGQLHYSLPFGARIRLKASYNISGFSANNKIILQAMKTYGLMLADIGSNMYISGAPDSRWNNDDLHQMDKIHASDFEVVKFSN
ncbi:MAG: hypothetical protein ABI861_10715 [Panacibacter sp.]